MSPETEELAERVRNLIGHKPGVVEKKMFGGYGFMLNGNFVVGSMSTGEILLRADPAKLAETMALSGAGPMMMGEREMTGFYTVDYDSIAHDDDLQTWIDRSWSYVKTMPPKKPKPAKTARKAVAKAPAKRAAAKKAHAGEKAPAKKAAPEKR